MNVRFLREGCYLYLYVNGKQVASVARTWDDIAAQVKAWISANRKREAQERTPEAKGKA